MSRSSTEALYRSLSETACALSWIKPSHTEKSPSLVVLPAQRLVSKAEDKNKRGEGPGTTQANIEVNGLRLYNQYSALDSLEDQD